MKEKIDFFAKGVFSYEKPGLLISVETINISAEAGKTRTGSFCVLSSAGTPFRGLVFSSSELIKLESTSFSEAQNTIVYTVDATYLDRDDSIKGRISVVSEYGERHIPFIVNITTPVYETSVGPACDPFHFASLAQTNWSEAKELFRDKNFGRIFFYNDRNMTALARVLCNSGNISLAVEEFLVASHKKRGINIIPERAELAYDNPREVIEDTLVIKKDTWGYSQLTVETAGEFVSCDTKVIWTDDFENNRYSLSFSIDPTHLHSGTNYGRLVISSFEQKLVIPIICKNRGKELNKLLAGRRRKHFELKLHQYFLDYRIGNIGAAKFAAEVENVLGNLKQLRPEGLYARLAHIYVQLISGRASQAEIALSVIAEDKEWNGVGNMVYAVFLYLTALSSDDPLKISDIMNRLRTVFEQDGDPRIFVLCIQLDKKKRISNNARFDGLRKASAGCAIPQIVLLEAALVADEDPSVLKEFGEFELQVIRFGVANTLLHRDALLKIAYLASRAKSTTMRHVKVLRKAFEQYKLAELLEAVCTQYILLGVTDKESYRWLSLGVKEQLMVRNLCENCLSAAGEALDAPLPKQLITYFDNGDRADDAERTALYANALLYYDQPDILTGGLRRNIAEFAVDHISNGLINRGLAVIYNKGINREDLNERAVRMLPEIIYKHRIEIERKDIVSVLVAHKEENKEKSYPVTDGVAYVDIYTEKPVLICVDEKGNRLASPASTPERLVDNPELIALCEEKCLDDERVLLSCTEASHYHTTVAPTIDLVRRCAELADIDKCFAIECYRYLIEYYYEELEGELMESYLVRLNLAELDRRTRARMMDLMVLRELYSLAMKNMELYGFNGVEIKRLVKLAIKQIESVDKPENGSTLMDICIYIFRRGRSTEEILKYLVAGYIGDSETMYEIWKAACEAGIDTSGIEERLLETLLFTESDMSYASDVFMHYYGRSVPGKLARAYLSFYAYGYLAHGKHPADGIIEIMRREADYTENEITVLALLKYYSGLKELSGQDTLFVSRRLEQMERAGIVFPFFKDFGAGVKIPGSLGDKTFIEYHTDPRKTVRIHYLMFPGTRDDKYTVEDMADAGYGIFLKEFVLFCGEVIQYYITEQEPDGEEKLTEASALTVSMDSIGNEDDKYHQLNLIIAANEMNDSKTMYRMLENYIRTDYMCRHLFDTIE